MADRDWIKRGPRVFGYEPGWLWWAAVLVVVGGGLFYGSIQFDTQRKNRVYLEQRAAFHAAEQGLDVVFVNAVIEAESGWDWRAESPIGAKGLMQVTDIALQDVKRLEGIEAGNLFDVDYNLRVGTLYLSYLLDRFDGDIALAVAAYHMGPTRVAKGQRKYPDLSPRDMIDKHGGPQTRAYVKKVLKLIEEHTED
ncbi:MAG: lytic transglycosylase domain-containing protein [Phycisphaeraceae bacterium]|nr:lytic transglycosylase domain-containing protein [Phycisphaeraceae bacterium]